MQLVPIAVLTLINERKRQCNRSVDGNRPEMYQGKLVGSFRAHIAIRCSMRWKSQDTKLACAQVNLAD